MGERSKHLMIGAVVAVALLLAVWWGMRVSSMLAWYEGEVVPVRNAVRLQQQMAMQPAAAAQPTVKSTPNATPSPKN